MIDTVNRLNSSTDLDRLAGIVILAGGNSKRMGTPKAELTLQTGERLLDYHVKHALDLNAPIMIADNGRGFMVSSDLSVNNPQSSIIHIADYGAAKNEEQTHTGGALVAIESALQTLTKLKSSDKKDNADSSWLLVISCDSLIPATDLWQKLQLSISHSTENQTNDRKVICLTDDSHLYPLLGVYQLSIEPDLKAYIDNGQRRVIQFITPIVQAVSFAKNWQHLTNFNTPEDFQRACAALID